MAFKPNVGNIARYLKQNKESLAAFRKLLESLEIKRKEKKDSKPRDAFVETHQKE